MYLAWLKSSTTKLQWFQYLKLVFLEIPNVTIQLVFQNQVTYMIDAGYYKELSITQEPVGSDVHSILFYFLLVWDSLQLHALSY